MNKFKQLALIGPTASGKSALSIELAEKMSANILSLDSLAIYKDIDIASAKPTVEERKGIVHFGIDFISPNETFDVTTFIDLYHEVKATSVKENKNLIIVGGTTFYLKSLLTGISPMPTISEQTFKESKQLLLDVKKAYQLLYVKDSDYMSNIATTDYYRIEKMLNLFLETGMTPTDYFKEHPAQKIITEPLPIYEIEVEREVLRERISKRTEKMLHDGLIDEVFYLEKTYSRKPNCMSSIGIKEVLAFFDGIYNKKEMRERIVIHTAQLAKRQRTFNKSQFQEKTLLPLDKLRSLLG